DVRQIVQAGLQEHSQLDYKQAHYGDDKKEFLLDVCQFANSAGGILLVGVPEQRGADGPTGIPDPNAQLGIELANPGAERLRLDAWVTSHIEETLQIESWPIDMGNQ